MTADEILAIPLSQPLFLFKKDKVFRHEQFRDLAKVWHPDISGRNDVMAHITALYAAIDNPVNTIVVESRRDGKKYALHYLRTHPFELGTMAIGHNIITFLIDRKHGDLVLNGLKAIGSVRYPDSRMKDQHARFVPNVERVVDTETQDVVVIKKDPDVILLRDLLDRRGPMDPKHVAWVVSSLLNLTCFYEIIGLCHNGLSTDTVFISPLQHTAFPAGGWWYATWVRSLIKFLPPSSHAVAPRDMLRTKTADHRLDLECIRAIARTCLGNPTGGSLSMIPKPFMDFLRLPAPKSPLKDYENWETVLKNSYGPRRYLKLDIDANAIYG